MKFSNTEKVVELAKECSDNESLSDMEDEFLEKYMIKIV